MNFRKMLNLNSYEWWRNHRRVITFGGFLILFSCWLNPIIENARNQNKCIEILREEYLMRNERYLSTASKEKESFLKAYQDCKN